VNSSLSTDELPEDCSSSRLHLDNMADASVWLMVYLLAVLIHEYDLFFSPYTPLAVDNAIRLNDQMFIHR